ncbi:MAG: phage baseplate assembly protein V [Methanothrix sp.]
MKAVEVIKKVAESEVRKLHTLEMGIVTSTFPHSSAGDKDNYECNVLLKNRDIELRRVPIATQQMGLVNLPNVGDLVLLSFLCGDINAPVVMGRLYNDEFRPPLNNSGEMIFESPDPKKEGVRRMHLKFPSGIVLTVMDDELRAEVGKSVVTIKTDGDITIESNASMNIKAKGDISLSAQNVKIESRQALEIKAGTTAKVDASATLDLKGGTTKVEASATLDLKGGIVNIN